jgi:hypothetical protein
MFGVNKKLSCLKKSAFIIGIIAFGSIPTSTFAFSLFSAMGRGLFPIEKIFKS